MNFGIFVNETRDPGFEIATKVANILIANKVTPVYLPKFKDSVLNTIDGVVFDDFKNIECKILISIGGDGTFLSMVSDYRSLDCVFIGINKGSIGFLTEISTDNLEESLLNLINDNYKIEYRSQLFVELFDSEGNLKGQDICLNDCLIARGAKPHITKLVLKIDGQVVERFYGDGLVVSTATGSTAYSLAAGGPLLMPEMKDMIVASLCSHTLHNISYVTGPDSTIEIFFEDFESSPIICPDGHDFLEPKPFDCVKITRYDKCLKSAHIGKDVFFSKVRKKIIQRGYFYENG